MGAAQPPCQRRGRVASPGDFAQRCRQRVQLVGQTDADGIVRRAGHVRKGLARGGQLGAGDRRQRARLLRLDLAAIQLEAIWES